MCSDRILAAAYAQPTPYQQPDLGVAPHPEKRRRYVQTEAVMLLHHAGIKQGLRTIPLHESVNH